MNQLRVAYQVKSPNAGVHLNHTFKSATLNSSRPCLIRITGNYHLPSVWRIASPPIKASNESLDASARVDAVFAGTIR